jgi:PAS domain S-box-containing protein
MDFERIKQNLRFRSGRSNQSKRFPTAESLPFQQAPRKEPEAQPTSPAPQRRPKRKVQNKEPSPGASEEKSGADQRAIAIRGRPGSRSAPGTEISPQATDEDAEKMKLGAINPKQPKLSSDERDERSPEVAAVGRVPTSSNAVAEIQKSFTRPRSTSSNFDTEAADFDLRAPRYSKPKATKLNLEILFDLLLSEGYLGVVTSDPQLLARFAAFLNRYKPEVSHVVVRYVEVQKVLKAVQYANAVAAGLAKEGTEVKGKGSAMEDQEEAAVLSASFLHSSRNAFNTLVNNALPAWVTYSLVRTATACLTAEITNLHSSLLTRGLVGGLSEVFTITDPNQEDNPIIYASEEFYRLTGYDKDAVIGHNCRFLQGPRTKRESVQRLREAIIAGQEISETLLNYRRDGRPFVNLLMLAPLHDDRGKVKYYLGAQVDASRLVEGGKGVEGFEQFLATRELESERRGRDKIQDRKQLALAKLRDLSMTFDLEESAVVQSHSRSSSTTRERDDAGSAGSTSRLPRKERRVLRDDEGESGSDGENDEKERDGPAWDLSHIKPSGGLPGIYRKYFFVRPYPSLRIVFVSPAMRKVGQLQQRPFLAHVAASASTLAGLKESFASGIPVTAKVAIMPESGKNREGTAVGRDLQKCGVPSWISATPLLDSEDKIGVWMVVLVDKTVSWSSASWTTDATPPTKQSKTSSQVRESEQKSNGIEESIAPKVNGLSSNYVESAVLAPHRAYPRSVGENEESREHKINATTKKEDIPRPKNVADCHNGRPFTPEKDPHQNFQTPQPDTIREDSGDDEYTDANNAATEPPNGLSATHTNTQTHSQPYPQPSFPPSSSCSTEPTLTNPEPLTPDIRKRPASSYGMDSHTGRPASGILRMDYLSSRSPTTNGGGKKVLGWDDVMRDGDGEEGDWPERPSPYSVD